MSCFDRTCCGRVVSSAGAQGEEPGEGSWGGIAEEATAEDAEDAEDDWKWRSPPAGMYRGIAEVAAELVTLAVLRAIAGRARHAPVGVSVTISPDPQHSPWLDATAVAGEVSSL